MTIALHQVVVCLTYVTGRAGTLVGNITTALARPVVHTELAAMTRRRASSRDRRCSRCSLAAPYPANENRPPRAWSARQRGVPPGTKMCVRQ
jgi:hypothetical protein